jgi:small redox-active disulfide protein 2
MKKIQILGPGCPNCRRLAELTDRVAGELGLEYELEKVTDIVEITRFGVMATPALALDGNVLVSGRVPSETEIKSMLQ